MTLEEHHDAARRAVNTFPSLISFFNEGRNWLSAMIVVPQDRTCGIVTFNLAVKIREAGFEVSKVDMHRVSGPDLEVMVRSLTASGKGRSFSRFYLPLKERSFSAKQAKGWDEWLLHAQSQGVNSFKGFFY